MIETLRPAQAQALAYDGGPMAISAVPGAGKTFILTRLAVRLIRELGVLPRQILILTYMRGAAMTFKSRIAEALSEHGLSAFGLQAMTIHAFCLSVIKRHLAINASEEVLAAEMVVISEVEAKRTLKEGLALYLQDPEARTLWQSRYRSDWDKYDPVEATVRAAVRIVSVAKHHGLSPEAVDGLLGPTHPELAFLYRHYRDQQRVLGLVDYDDQVSRAIALLREDPELLAWYQARYRYVLEDEAQDSTPGQHELIRLLSAPEHGGSGNLVRVGDSNQSITTTFTFNDPRFFRAFCEGLEGRHRHVRMAQSSRSAPEILALANALVEYAGLHPDPAVTSAFAPLPIQVSTEGKTNPAAITSPDWTFYPSHEAERDGVLLAARKFLRDHPQASAAILLYRQADVDAYGRQAFEMGIPVFDGELSGLSSQPVIAMLSVLLAILAEPSRDHRSGFLRLVQGWLSRHEQAWDDPARVKAFLAATPLEALVFPATGLPPARPMTLGEKDYGALLVGAGLLRQLYEGRWLSAEELLPRLAEGFFEDPKAPLVAAKALALARRSARTASGNPWRDLLVEFDEIHALTAKKDLIDAAPPLVRPRPGQLQILTVHRSKGAEYEAVWLPALGYTGSRKASDGTWPRTSYFPWWPTEVRTDELDQMVAEAILARGDRHGVSAPSVLEREAQLATIAERMRLLYVGITRAERALHLSASHDRRNPAPAPQHVLFLSSRLATGEVSP